MGFFTSKKKTTTDQTQNESSAVTPTNPQWSTDAIQGFVGKIGQWGAKDPSAMVAGPSGLQTQAWGRAGALGGGDYGEALGLARKAGGAGPNLAGGNFGYTPGLIGAPQKANATGYNSTLADRTQIGDFQRGNASHVGGFAGYDPSLMDRTVIDPTERVDARTGASFMDAYKDPYMRDVVDTTLADYDDNAGQLRARQAAQAAGNKAFGGSRYAIQEAQTEGELARGRASTAAGLRSNAFNTAAGLGMADANRFLQADSTNAGNSLQRGISQAGMDQSRLEYNAGAMTGARKYMTDWTNQGIMSNADRDQQMEQFNVGNQVSRTRDQAGMDASWQGANADRSTGAARDLFNVGNQFESDYAGRANDRQMAQWGAGNDAARYNADRGWDFERFNVGQQDQAAARQMQSAQLISQIMQQYGVDERQAIQLMATLGEQERGIDQQQRMAELAQLEAQGQLYGATPFQLFQGQQGTGTTKMTGTGTERGTPSMFNSILAAASVASKFVKPSERRLKRDIKKVGTLPNGLNVYDFRYVWDADTLHRGVMVDEVEQIQPDALGPIVNGIQTVDYAKVEGWAA